MTQNITILTKPSFVLGLKMKSMLNYFNNLFYLLMEYV